MIVLDTNVVSEMLRPAPNAQVMSWLSEHSKALTITAVTVAELSLGLQIMPQGSRKDGLRRHLDAIFASYGDRILGLDTPAGRHYGDVVSKRRSIGRPITTEDAMIAAICLTHALPLATRNCKDFDDLNLKLINPWTPPDLQ